MGGLGIDELFCDDVVELVMEDDVIIFFENMSSSSIVKDVISRWGSYGCFV